MCPHPPQRPQHKGWSCLALPQLGPWQAALPNPLLAAAGKPVRKQAVSQLLPGRDPPSHSQAAPGIRSDPSSLLWCSMLHNASDTLALAAHIRPCQDAACDSRNSNACSFSIHALAPLPVIHVHGFQGSCGAYHGPLVHPLAQSGKQTCVC